MQYQNNTLLLSASDLSNFLACRRRTALDLALANGLLATPTWVDPMAALLRDRGDAHERKFAEKLIADGRTVLDLRDDDAAIERTLQAMRDGVDVIYQAKFVCGRWVGYVDFMQRIEEPSALGPWSYEVYDTKLARETKAGTILQLAVYSDLLASVQGRRPDHFYVVTPDAAAPLHRYRLADFDAYYRLVQRQLEADVAKGLEALLDATYPEPVQHCDVCRWFPRCEAQRRKDDHLSFVAGISRVHRTELQSQGITTLTELARIAVPLTFKPSRGARTTYERLQDQAQLQVLQRQRQRPELKLLLPPNPDHGLSRLPEPSPGDLFLDFEGDPFARERGREYLFGLWQATDPAYDGTNYRCQGFGGQQVLPSMSSGTGGTKVPPSVSSGTGTPFDSLTLAQSRNVPPYVCWWAFDDRQERVAFEAVVEWIMERWAADPGMHVYHFGHYEPSALKRLMGRYASREDAIDRLLRSGRFVDLHLIVRHALRAGVESYSIKQLEPFYAFQRDIALHDAAPHRRTLEIALETNAIGVIGEEVKNAVEGYNRDDCRSTLALRTWLQALRAHVIESGTPIPRPIPKPADASPRVSELQARVEALRARLLHDVPADPVQRNDDQQTRWLLAYLLDWHRREDKVAWWEYFRLRDLPEEDLYDEPQAIAGLEFVSRLEELRTKTGKPTGIVIERYTYPVQEMELREDDELKLRDETAFGEVDDVDRVRRFIDVRKTKKTRDVHPSAVFAHKYFSPETMQKSLLRLAERVTADESDRPATGTPVVESRTAGLDLLFRRPPRLARGAFIQRCDESVLEFAVRCGLDLDASALAIQGPPGSGKTFTGARMICALLKAGKRVGVTAVSHKVIRNLLEAVRREAASTGADVRCGHKTRPRHNDPAEIAVVDDNNEALSLLANGRVNVLGGTAWLWAREQAAASVDVLFVDEAGQMSLANVLAASQAGTSLVLLGDPQQLEQPQKGSHPDGVDISALEHVLGRSKTIPAERGLFLPLTWRLAPSICQFTSEAFYEGRLESKEGLENQALVGVDPFNGAGLWWVPVEHERNQNWSIEEIDAVEKIVASLLQPGARWIDERRYERQLTAADILVVAPYNAQVNRLQERLESTGVRVGTVDKFQGQEAPVAIYSMTSSSAIDAPRGMEFLYSLNRLNVATSRARCAALLVASPKLFEPECRTPRQMQLANALCRFREMACAVSNGWPGRETLDLSLHRPQDLRESRRTGVQ